MGRRDRAGGRYSQQGTGCMQRYNTLRDLRGCGLLGSGDEMQGRVVVCLDSEKWRTFGVPRALQGVSCGCWCQERWGTVWKEPLS